MLPYQSEVYNEKYDMFACVQYTTVECRYNAVK